MFRNPRENNARELAEAILPSVGRPPTPPDAGSPYFHLPNTPAKPSMSSPAPIASRPPATRLSTTKKGKQNLSILSFFGKAERSEANSQYGQEESLLFFDDTRPERSSQETPKLSAPLTVGELLPGAQDDNGSPLSRYNEVETPIKRRRLDNESADCLIRTPSPERREVKESTASEPAQPSLNDVSKRRGGFVDDSDEEDEDMSGWNTMATDINEDVAVAETEAENERNQISTSTTIVPLKPPDLSHEEGNDHEAHERPGISNAVIPALTREGTSMYDAGDFGDEENFEDEFYEEGDEYMERKWMQQQGEMEAELDEDSKSESGTESVRTPQDNFQDEVSGDQTGENIASCPLCGGSLKDLTESQASSHVNACLDGNAPPLPVRAKPTPPAALQKPPQVNGASGHRRFQRAAIPRPAQANPFMLSKDKKEGQSAFSKLMSGHAEDAAWAEAANNDKDSRGRPAYQRTCPFYKIMPGLYVCVDAFRYGKVEGQSAYFLSHFHSDHYIGLTSSWAHGPIYASKVTCNLMRQVLRVDPEWIVPLEFEKKIEVPNTKGVFVTMIPANHCPGSSLYMFEKVIGKNKDGSPRMTRILHCGDFRACPAHISHPLLKPDVLDAITGQTKQQVIDTCYLDTTYLTPKYSFPGQHDVIDACAQMCISLSKEIADSSDAFEQAKAERMGSTMSKFLEKGETEIVRPTEEDVKPRMRGRLLVIIGTYSIGKERICLGIARALRSKIFAPPAKMRICKCLEDAELNSLLTSNPLEAQVHMQTLMEIRAETLHDYLVGFKPHFARVVGFRPTGWSYRPPTSRFTENPAVNTVLNSEGWKSRFTMRDLAPQRGSTKESNCFGVPYSEHSSFRELTMFCCALRINRIVPTVNVSSAKSREKMKGWIEKWDVEKRKNGLYKVEVGGEGWGSGDGALHYGV